MALEGHSPVLVFDSPVFYTVQFYFFTQSSYGFTQSSFIFYTVQFYFFTQSSFNFNATSSPVFYVLLQFSAFCWSSHDSLVFLRFSTPDKLLVARDVNVFLLDPVEAASASLFLSDVTLECLGSSFTSWRMIVSIFLVFNLRK